MILLKKGLIINVILKYSHKPHDNDITYKHIKINNNDNKCNNEKL